MADRVRLDIVFEGGASLSVNVPTSTADDLDAALAADDRESISFEGEDGRYTLNVGKILFVRRSQREQVVGFGAVRPPSES